MLQSMETWCPSGVTGKDTDTSGVDRLCTGTAGSSGSTDDARDSGVRHSSGNRIRSLSLPARAKSQTEYLDSLRALAQEYSLEERRRYGSNSSYDLEEESGGHLTRQRSATMIDTSRNRGRMDSELTSDSDRTFDLSPAGHADPGDVFTLPASEDEKAKIINSRLHELDSCQRSWKKRVADYVHGLPLNKPLSGEGGRVQDPKRRRLWTTGCDRLPWEINSSDGVTPRQRVYTVSSESTYSASQLSTSSSRDSIQHWVDSIDDLEDPDATLIPGQSNGNTRKVIPSPSPIPSPKVTGRKVSNPDHGIPKAPSSSAADDDLGLGADAESVTGSTKDEDIKSNQVVGPGGKCLSRKLTNSDIINMATQTRALQSRRKQLQRMGSSAKSESSLASVSDLLFARNDPEELLLNLGFGGGKEPDPLERIPARFLQRPSMARGISVNNFLMLSETQDQKYGFSLQGGLRGLGAILPNSMCALQDSSQYPTRQENVDLVSSRLESVTQEASPLPVEPAEEIGSPNGKEKPISQTAPRISKEHLTGVRNGLVNPGDLNSQTKDTSANDESIAGCLTSNSANEKEVDVTSSPTLEELVRSSTRCDVEGYSEHPDLNGLDAEGGGGSSRGSEEHRRSRNARMIMPEPLLPPVDEELEAAQTSHPRKPQVREQEDANQDLKLDTEEDLRRQETHAPTETHPADNQEEMSSLEKRAATLISERAPKNRLTHMPESFEIEEISSTENQEDNCGVSKGTASDKPPEKGVLVRTDSAQSDSSGFADEVMDSTYASSSPTEECNGQESPPGDHDEDSSLPEVGNKLIQTSFDDYGVLESFEWDECPTETQSGRTAKSFEDEKDSESGTSTSLSSVERIARSRKSFRESRSSYERMGSTFSGISISSLEDSPFEGESSVLPERVLHVPRQRSDTYPAAVERQMTPSGPKTVVEILTSLHENIKQASQEGDSEKQSKKRPTLSKMKSVDLDYFPHNDIPSLMDSVDFIVGRTKQDSASVPDRKDSNAPSVVEIQGDLNPILSLTASKSLPTAAMKDDAEEIGKSPVKLLKKRSSQISMVPTLPCLSEERTPSHSRHSSVTDTTHAGLQEQHSSPLAEAEVIQEIVECTDQEPVCIVDGKPDELYREDLRSATDTPVSMIANVDSVGDIGDLEEEMQYLEYVESLLKQEGKLLDEASSARVQSRSKVEGSFGQFQEEPLVPELLSKTKINPSTFVVSECLNQSEATIECSISNKDPPSYLRLIPQESLRQFQEEAVSKVSNEDSSSKFNPSTFVNSECFNELETIFSEVDHQRDPFSGVGESLRCLEEDAAVFPKVECNSQSNPSTNLSTESLNQSETTVGASLTEVDHQSCSRVGKSFRPFAKFEPFKQEVLVSQVESTSHISCPSSSTTDVSDSLETTLNGPSSEAGLPLHDTSGISQSLFDADGGPDTPNASSSVEVMSSQSAKLVESSVCLYLSPTPFVIDISKATCSHDEDADGVNSKAQQLCNFPEAKLLPQRYRTSFELALDGETHDEGTCSKNSDSLRETTVKVKPEDDLHDIKLIQRALFKYKQDLCELESLAERMYSRHLEEEDTEDGTGGMTARETAELESVRELRRQVMDEVEVMEEQLAQRMKVAIARRNFPDGLENCSAIASQGSMEVIQEMVNLLEEQRTLRRMLQDLELTHSNTTPSEASTIPDLSAFGSTEWAEPYQEEAPGNVDGHREMMQALSEVRMELQQQRDLARREMNSAIKEMRQSIASELRQELQLDAQLFQRQLQAKDKEIEQLKTLLVEQRRLQDGE